MKVRRLAEAPALRCGNAAAEVAIVGGPSILQPVVQSETSECELKAFVWLEVPGGHVPMCQRCWSLLVFQSGLDAETKMAAMGIESNRELNLPMELPAGRWNVVSDGSFILLDADEEDDEEDEDGGGIDDPDWEEVGDEDDEFDEDDDDEWDDEEEDEDDEDWGYEDVEEEMYGVFTLNFGPSASPSAIAFLKTFALAQQFLTAWITQAEVEDGAEFVIAKAELIGTVPPPNWEDAKDCQHVVKRGS
jgi:hypothetical protein